MSFPRYPKYKDSGIEWLGEVPEHWNVIPFSRAVEFQEGPGIMASDFQEDGVPLLRVAGMQGRWATLDGCNFLSPEKVSTRWSHFRLNRGDLLISASASMGTICEVDEKTEGAIPYTGLIRLIGRNGVMGKHFVRSTVVSSLFAVQIDLLKAGTTIQHFGPTHLRQVKTVCPPLDEQTKIAAFLDSESVKIDALVAEQQRLIELLKEKRQALISHAVTKGLNPNVALKPSGIAWLGDVPEHWDVKKIKYLSSRISSGKTPLGGSEVYVDEGITFLRSQNVYDEGLRLDDVVFISESVDEAMAVSRVMPNDILLNITGASIGRSCVVPCSFPSANVNQHVCVIRLKQAAQVPFVGWLFKSATIKNQIDHAQNGAAREGLNFAQIGEMAIAMPPDDEQRSIASFLHNQTEKLDTLTAEAQHGIELLQERRTALISAAVTGKIDVRSLVHAEAAR